ncbi:MAG TPA: peptidylprolyl isomerase, partial [Chloroflexota bacterium]|nr:peptidylprolyl isomerase [Chloroflexota bacterium]
LAIVLIALAIPAYAYYHLVLRLGDSPALVVDGQTFSLEQYARYVGSRRAMIGKQILQVEPQATPATANAGALPTANQLSAQQTLQQLQSEQTGLTSSGVSDLEEAKLVVTEGTARGYTATRAELDDAARAMLGAPTADALSSQGLVAAPPAGTYTGTLTMDAAKQDLTQIESNAKLLSADQVDELILKPAVFKARLVAALAGTVATTAEQVHARHILVKTEAEALAAKKELDGGADFAAVAAKYSIDTGSKDKGGDLGWFSRGMMIPEFEQAAFTLQPGTISAPVKSSYGYHLIEVLEKDPNRPLDPARLQQLRQQGYRDWLSKATSDVSRVTDDLTSPKIDWVTSYVASSG